MSVEAVPRRDEWSFSKRVASKIRGLMAEAGVRQSGLAALLQLSQAGVSRRLSGKTDFTVSELGSIADWLGVHPAEFFGAPPPPTGGGGPHGNGPSSGLPRQDSNLKPAACTGSLSDSRSFVPMPMAA